MMVVTAGISIHQNAIDDQMMAVAAHSRSVHEVFNLGGLQYGVPFDAALGIAYKPTLMRSVLARTSPNGLVMWMDPDRYPVRDFYIPGKCGGFDVAVTVPANITSENDIRTNVLWIRNTPAGRAFCNAWRLESVDRDETTGLILAMGVKWTPDTLRRAVGERVNSKHAVIRFLDSAEWDSLLPDDKQTRITRRPRL